MKKMMMCQSQKLIGAIGMAKQLCGDGKMGGSGSGGGKKDGEVCDMALKSLGVLKGLQDVKSELGMTACNMYNDMGKDMMSKLMMCKSPKLKVAMAEAKALCAGKKVVAKEVIETKIVQKKQVEVTQGISKDFTLPKYTKIKEGYEVAFLDTSGADKAESTVEYTQVAATSTGRRRLAEGTSVAKWVLGFENDDKAIAAQAKVGSKEFSDTVAKESGVQVEAAKASIKTVDVKVNVKKIKYEVVDKPASGSSDKPASGSSGGLRIRSPNACIEMGDDIKIKRVGDGKLGFDANVKVHGAVSVKELYVGGMSIEEIVRKMVAEALKNK